MAKTPANSVSPAPASIGQKLARSEVSWSMFDDGGGGQVELQTMHVSTFEEHEYLQEAVDYGWLKLKARR
jgi:hypothetical protein